MNKDYQKPEVEFISLIVEDEITTGDGIIDGDTGVESSDF